MNAIRYGCTYKNRTWKCFLYNIVTGNEITGSDRKREQLASISH